MSWVLKRESLGQVQGTILSIPENKYVPVKNKLYFQIRRLSCWPNHAWIQTPIIFNSIKVWASRRSPPWAPWTSKHIRKRIQLWWLIAAQWSLHKFPLAFSQWSLCHLEGIPPTALPKFDMSQQSSEHYQHFKFPQWTMRLNWSKEREGQGAWSSKALRTKPLAPSRM